jgi:hypothetical protein
VVAGNSKSYLPYANIPGNRGLMGHLSWNPKQRRVVSPEGMLEGSLPVAAIIPMERSLTTSQRLITDSSGIATGITHAAYSMQT